MRNVQTTLSLRGGPLWADAAISFHNFGRKRNHLDKDSFTAKYNVTKLVYYEETTDVRAAIEREKQIKSWSRMKKFFLVQKENPGFPDIYPSLLG